MTKKLIGFALAGYATQPRFDTKKISLFWEHGRKQLQHSHYADDWDEEDDANGWRYSQC